MSVLGKAYIESLGCDKNLVDSENMLGLLVENGYELTMDPFEAEIVVINSCSFIHDAKQESIDTIIKYGELKETGKLKKIIVTGCLTQLYKEELLKELPEVDAILGTSSYDKVIEAIKELDENEKYICFNDINDDPKLADERVLETTKHYAYLKIAEGCNNRCSYCIIPSLRGNFRSRTIEDILKEAKYLADNDKREIILVAQDVGKYGTDLYGKRTLPELIQKLSEIEGIKWIRILYVYPEDITDELIDTMSTNSKVLHYIDMPLQHADNKILKLMARRTTKDFICERINKLREKMTDICIRTTFIVGFPGETEQEYENLKSFLIEQKLDRVGVFTYSREENTRAYDMDGQLEEETKEFRRDELMKIQQEISTKNNQKMIGKTLELVVDAYVPSEEIYIARSYKDTPDVDSYVFVEAETELLSGDYIKANIKAANDYDLIGEFIEFVE